MSALDDHIAHAVWCSVWEAHRNDDGVIQAGPCRCDVDAARAALAALREAKDGAYRERDALVCALSKLFPSRMGRHPDSEPWDDDWRWIVFVQLPTGQASWHIHDSELPMFAHLEGSLLGTWDGHTTAEKYERLAQLPMTWAFSGSDATYPPDVQCKLAAMRAEMLTDDDDPSPLRQEVQP